MLSNLLDKNSVLLDVSGTEKDELLEKVINGLKPKVDRQTLDKIRNAVFEREAIMSTGVGKGLAIPHGKVAGIDKNYAILARTKEEIEFDAIDDNPVRLIFLLIGPQSNNSEHIKLLSRISRLMNNEDFRHRLLNCSSSAELLETFKQEEQLYFGK